MAFHVVVERNAELLFHCPPLPSGGGNRDLIIDGPCTVRRSTVETKRNVTVAVRRDN